MSGGGAAGGAQVGIGALQLWNAKNTSDMIKQQAAFQAQQEEFNSRLMQIRKKEIVEQSQKDIAKYGVQGKQMRGSQKVAMAAQGVELDSETMVGLQTDLDQVISDDIQTIKNNAWRQAMGLEIESTNLKYQSQMTRLGGASKARSTRNQGILDFASSASSGGYKIYKG